jgi:polygalacturonase
MKLAAGSIFLVSFILFSYMSYGKEINIISLGAKPDSLSDNTAIIQSAIDQCYLAGGGRVIVPAGKYITGSLNLKSNVELHLESGAVIIGSINPADYPQNDIALIFAHGQKNISVTGNGSINGRGNSEVWQMGDNAEGRPKIIYFVDCQDVLVEGVTLTNAAFWVSDYRGCNYVKINNVKIYSYGNHNNDGIDIDSRNVVVSDCIVETDDDALCFKSHTHDRPCENVAVTNCVLASNCNAIKFGTASHGGFRNISVNNCIVKRPVEDQIRQWHKQIEGIDSGHTVISGIALESVDGGIMDQVKISDIIMDGVQTPIFIKLGDRRRYSKVPGQLKNVQINNIVARNASLISSSITGFPGHYIENVSISNVQITYKGGGTRKHYEYEPPENEKGYPENRMFGHYLPSYGFFIRHVKNLLLNNIQLSLNEPDYRSVVKMNDVEDIKINGMQADNPGSEAPVFEITNGENIIISETWGWKKHDKFLSLDEKSNGIIIMNNDLSNFSKIAEPTSKEQIKLINNNVE